MFKSMVSFGESHSCVINRDWRLEGGWGAGQYRLLGGIDCYTSLMLSPSFGTAILGQDGIVKPGYFFHNIYGLIDLLDKYI